MSSPLAGDPLQEALEDCYWEHRRSQVDQLLTPDRALKAFPDAINTFSQQYTKPDPTAFTQTCNQLTEFLQFFPPGPSLTEAEQKSLLVVLTVGCSILENVIKEPTLTDADRSAYKTAGTVFYQLCEDILYKCIITGDEPFFDVINLMCQVDRITETGPYAEDTKHGETSASRAATPRASVHDTTRVGQTSERKERLCVLLDGRPSKGPTALGRAHSMPVISRARSTSISHSSPSGKRGAPSKPHSRGQGLQAVKE